MGKEVKTNAMRILESNNILYKELVLDIDEALDGVTCANMLGLDIDSTFKTLVTVGKSGNYYVFVVPVAKKLSLKKAALSVNEKNVEMIPMKELLPLTGYIRGGCSPIGMKKAFPTYFHQSALNFDEIFVSAGVRGLQLKISPQDLIKYVRATITDLIQSKETDENDEHDW